MRNSLGEASLCGWCAVVESVGVSTCKEGRQLHLVVRVNVRSVSFCLSNALGIVSKEYLA